MDAIQRTPETYESDDLIAQHIPPAASTPSSGLAPFFR
jgi:hypothetical protein